MAKTIPVREHDVLWELKDAFLGQDSRQEEEGGSPYLFMA